MVLESHPCLAYGKMEGEPENFTCIYKQHFHNRPLCADGDKNVVRTVRERRVSKGCPPSLPQACGYGRPKLVAEGFMSERQKMSLQNDGLGGRDERHVCELQAVSNSPMPPHLSDA